MNVLVINGRKMNSFALALECAVDFSSKGQNVFFVDTNPLFFARTTRIKIQKKILARHGIIKLVSIFECMTNMVKAARHANMWCKLASKSDTAWDEKALNGKLPLGRLVRSLIARSMGSSNFQLSECPASQVYDIAFKSIFSYLQTTAAIHKLDSKLDLGVAHGGRDSYSAGAICAFRENGIPTRLVESGGIPTRWSIFQSSPHFSPDFWRKLENSGNCSNSMEVISKWWSERLAGSDHFRTEEWGHTRTTGLLPPNLPNDFVSFFTTSDFEIPVFQDFDIFPGEFRDQREAFMALYNEAQECNIHIVVRRHPNSVDQFGNDRESQLWKDISEFPGLTYLGPKERVDSIALARESRTVFTFKSSVGIEAIWLGTPAFALGPARWAWAEDLRVWNAGRLKEAVIRKSESSREHAIRWANLMLTMDYPNTQFGSIQGNKCTFQGNDVTYSTIENTADKLLVSILEKITKAVT